ncbi:hypothetical protein [Streptomyces sp. NPDC048825]|uniref:hypothetical protein n=1 Tax=Streptomyces sp. NPDC048825 TaxID=3365592 RepID=UPI0037124219
MNNAPRPNAHPVLTHLPDGGGPPGHSARSSTDRPTHPLPRWEDRPPPDATESLDLPTRNAARNIPWVFEQTPGCVDEVTLVDGDSKDATVPMARHCLPTVRHEEIPHSLDNGYDFLKGSRFAVGGGSLDVMPFRRLSNLHAISDDRRVLRTLLSQRPAAQAGRSKQ